SNPTNGTISGSDGHSNLNIIDDDGPTVSISNAEATEGSPLLYTVTLSAPSPQAVTVLAGTWGGTARANDDYVSAFNIWVTFNAGQTSKQISVTTKVDDLVEPDETVVVKLRMVTNGFLPTSTA